MLYIILMHTSCFMIFLLMTYYLLFILYLFQTREMMLDKKKVNSSDLLIRICLFKVSHKAMQATHSISNASGSGTANECTRSIRGSRSFAKQMRTLKMRSIVASHREVDSDQLRGSSKLMLLQLHEKLLKISVSTILHSLGI